MSTPAEVGLFVDFENIRYGMLNVLGQEPDCQQLMEKARAYGPVAVAYAYADFAQQPAIYRRRLEVAGITPRDVPRRSPDVPHKSSADMAMLMDIIDCLLDRPNVHTLVLMTGDSDFIRVTARARHRFGKRVVISGVAGSVSADLVDSADLYDPLVSEEDIARTLEAEGGAMSPDTDETRLLQLVDWLSGNRPYMTFSFIRSHAMSPHHGLGLSEDRVTDILSAFKERGVLIEGTRMATDGRALRTLELNQGHPAIIASRRVGAPAFESAAERTEAASRDGRTAPTEDEAPPDEAIEEEPAPREAERSAT